MGSTSHDLSGEDASPRTHQFVDIPPGDEDVEPVWSDAKEEVGALTMPKISVQTSGTRHTVRWRLMMPRDAASRSMKSVGKKVVISRAKSL